MNNLELTKIYRISELSQKEFCAKLQTPDRTLRHWLNGDRPIPGVVEPALKWIMYELGKDWPL